MREDEVRAALDLLRRAALGGVVAAPETKITVAEIWEPYWTTHARHLRSGRSGVLTRWQSLGPFFGHRQALSVTKPLAEEYRDWRKAQKTRRGRPPAIGTLNLELSTLRSMFNWATEQKPPLLPYSPLANLHLEEANNVRQTKLAYEAELEMLLACCNPMVAAMVLALIDSGMRRLEVMRLRWDQIDMHTRFVRLPAKVTKNKKPRRPRLTRRAFDAVVALPRIGDYVFANPKTEKPFDPRHLYRMYEQAVKASGLKGVEGEKIVLHTLRHSFAYKARVRWKWSERAIMAQGGWTTRAAFDRYGIEDEDELVEASDLADAAIARERESMVLGERRGPRRIPPAPTSASKSIRTSSG